MIESGPGAGYNRKMRTFALVCMFVLLGSTATPVPALAADGDASANQTISFSRYCFKEELNGDTGKKTAKLGIFTMDVILEQKGNIFSLSFANYMPDSGQVLEVDDLPIKRIGISDFKFRFTDNWGNKGQGKLHLDNNDSAEIQLNEVGRSSDDWGKNASRQYGTYKLTKAACTDAETPSH